MVVVALEAEMVVIKEGLSKVPVKQYHDLLTERQ